MAVEYLASYIKSPNFNFIVKKNNSKRILHQWSHFGASGASSRCRL